MINNKSTIQRKTNILHGIARGISTFVAVFWLIAGIGSAISEPGPWSLESFIIAARTSDFFYINPINPTNK